MPKLNLHFMVLSLLDMNKNNSFLDYILIFFINVYMAVRVHSFNAILKKMKEESSGL